MIASVRIFLIYCLLGSCLIFCDPVPAKKNKNKILSYIFQTTSQNVYELLRPWPSNTFISIFTNELIIKVLVLLFPLICIITAIQAYLTFFGPSNKYVGYTGNRKRSLDSTRY